MKQLNLFNVKEKKVEKNQKWTLYVDGASRNNPGPSGAGIYLSSGNKEVVKKGHFLGLRTNNQAEYLALILGLFYAKKHLDTGDALEVIADSELLVRQMNGQYKVKNPELKRLQRAAFAMLTPFVHTIRHVLREHNADADALANIGIDKKIAVPEAFIAMLRNYEVSW